MHIWDWTTERTNDINRICYIKSKFCNNRIELTTDSIDRCKRFAKIEINFSLRNTFFFHPLTLFISNGFLYSKCGEWNIIWLILNDLSVHRIPIHIQLKLNIHDNIIIYWIIKCALTCVASTNWFQDQPQKYKRLRHSKFVSLSIRNYMQSQISSWIHFDFKPTRKCSIAALLLFKFNSISNLNDKHFHTLMAQSKRWL